MTSTFFCEQKSGCHFGFGKDEYSIGKRPTRSGKMERKIPVRVGKTRTVTPWSGRCRGVCRAKMCPIMLRPPTTRQSPPPLLLPVYYRVVATATSHCGFADSTPPHLKCILSPSPYSISFLPLDFSNRHHRQPLSNGIFIHLASPSQTRL